MLNNTYFKSYFNDTTIHVAEDGEKQAIDSLSVLQIFE